MGSGLNDYLKTADIEWYKNRLTGIMLCAVVVFALLIFRLFYLQVLEGKEYRRLSENNCIRLQDINPLRGLIFDRNGVLLVDNRPAFDLNITLKDAKPVKSTIKKLSIYTGISEQELTETISDHKGYSYKPLLLKRNIERVTLAAVEAHKFDLPGISVNVRSVRYYVYNNSAAHLTGYLGEINSTEIKKEKYQGYQTGDLIGKSGIENAAEEYLKGKRGGRQVEVNSAGQVVRILKTVEAKPGHNIYLTIDHKLQKKAEELTEGFASAVVAMDPANGEILAMASNPSFNPNAFVGGISTRKWISLNSNPFGPLNNKVIQGNYPPASTYKIITAIAGLEEGVIDENTTVYCPGYYEYGNRTFRCWKRWGHGTVDIIKALDNSCDVYFYQVGQKLGVDLLAKYAKLYGLGSRTGIKLAHEKRGLIPTAAWKKRRTGDEWMEGENLPIAIGQGYNLVTPVQMAVFISAISNGGIIFTPRIIKKMEAADSEAPDNPSHSTPVHEQENDTGKIAGRVSVSKKTMDIVKKGLWEVVNGSGTAQIARIEGIEICGKTGTGQVIGRKINGDSGHVRLPDHLKAHAWFVAYAPCDAPKIALAIIVENGEHGSGTASPIARELIKLYLRE
ncbi:MAG: penicillin-binding protein 2 [Desulfobacteraceae bacterium]|nr:penicillin-binding protein 2 [Desulfobacteraceae bacterium]